MNYKRWIVAASLLAAGFAMARFAPPLRSQDAAKQTTQPVAEGKFEFEIIECFDAKYEGDTPGFIGRHGGLDDLRPNASLGDPVFRGEQQIGKVTRLTWSRATGSLEIEFDPLPKLDINVGDIAWLNLGDDAP